MDITELSTTLSQVNLQEQIGFAVLENVQDLAKVETDALLNMMESIPTPGLGEHIDISL